MQETYNCVNWARQVVRHMAAKLTLRLDEDGIRDAKRVARARSVSLSEKDYVLVLLFLEYVSDKYAGVPFAPGGELQGHGRAHRKDSPGMPCT